jgi:hypothetical protein
MSDRTGRSKKIETRALIAKLSPAGRRRYLELILVKDFSVFLRKVFATVSPGDEFLPNWHIEHDLLCRPYRHWKAQAWHCDDSTASPEVDYFLGGIAGVPTGN